MQYHFQEGALQVPDYLGDATLNVLTPRPGNLGLTVVISRDDLQAGESLAQFTDRQMEHVSRQTAKFTRGQARAARLGGAAVGGGGKTGGAFKGIEGVIFEVSYKQQGRLSYLLQAVFELAGRRTLAFAFSSHAPLTEEQVQQAQAILASYAPHG